MGLPLDLRFAHAELSTLLLALYVPTSRARGSEPLYARVAPFRPAQPLSVCCASFAARL
jgi:hypothetical protein